MSARQATWNVMRARSGIDGGFAAHEVVGRGGFTSVDQVHAFVLEMMAAGVVERLPGDDGEPARYRVTRALEKVPPPAAEDTQTANLWRTMRMLKTFSTVELQAAATTEETPVTLPMAQRFIGFLKLAGYLTVIAKPAHGRPASYQLRPHMNTGPKAPVIRKVKEVFDANRGQVMWREVAP